MRYQYYLSGVGISSINIEFSGSALFCDIMYSDRSVTLSTEFCLYTMLLSILMDSIE